MHGAWAAVMGAVVPRYVGRTLCAHVAWAAVFGAHSASGEPWDWHPDSVRYWPCYFMRRVLARMAVSMLLGAAAGAVVGSFANWWVGKWPISLWWSFVASACVYVAMGVAHRNGHSLLNLLRTSGVTA